MEKNELFSFQLQTMPLMRVREASGDGWYLMWDFSRCLGLRDWKESRDESR